MDRRNSSSSIVIKRVTQSAPKHSRRSSRKLSLSSEKLDYMRQQPILLLLSLPNDYAVSSPHCTGLDALQQQMNAMNDDFQRNIREVRNRMEKMNNDTEHYKQFSVRNVIDNPNNRRKETVVSSARVATLSESKHKLATLLKEIVSRNVESTRQISQINNTVNEMTPVGRRIPDTRHKDCIGLTYPDVATMPTVSLVIIFHNEPLQLILRNVHSILDKTPSHLVHEIILVDDKSTLTYLKDDLDLYVSYLPKVKVIHNKRREGLVKSRMIGARTASGDVLVFFDAHMECNVQWLEPLLAVLMKEPTAILQPQVDIISGETLEYFSMDSDIPFVGGFGWDLRYSWFKLPVEFRPKSPTENFWTPVLVGNAIAARRDHFFRIGGFDEDLKIWGGEHFDLSFRNWLCAGRVYTVPCSRVGHLFKKAAGYSYDGDREAIIVTNLMRVAEIWLEDYKDIFYRVTKSSVSKMPKFTKEDIKSIRKRIELKRKLGCKPFKWYLRHVLTEQILPRQDALLFGEITHAKSMKCLHVVDDTVRFTGECYVYRILPYNTFTFTTSRQLMHKDRCVYIDDQTYNLRVSTCTATTGCVERQVEVPIPRKGRTHPVCDRRGEVFLCE
ncbi:inactive polypeptide N-acetylgalactosaminyltransferase-like protein 5 [Pecten maximus]|uniref:inactive polypeptide N-acetylgalactosaminyltransferase-like protein 5 n=1 Tax=Pecten maximus TaxID=6579 RepID=UPI001458208C|nr:inactive polypeptide N-acetylgalactosaminyltransferase-like protein 5 [Pecten maximus]